LDALLPTGHLKVILSTGFNWMIHLCRDYKYSGYILQAANCGRQKDRSSGKRVPPVLFTHPVLFTQKIDASQRHSAKITTSFPRRRQSSLSSDRAIKISPPGIALLYPSCLPGSFPLLETVFPCTVTFLLRE